MEESNNINININNCDIKKNDDCTNYNDSTNYNDYNNNDGYNNLNSIKKDDTHNIINKTNSINNSYVNDFNIFNNNNINNFNNNYGSYGNNNDINTHNIKYFTYISPYNKNIYIKSLQQNQKKLLLIELLFKFYNSKTTIIQFLDIVNGNSVVSLRIIEWFLTNYAKKNIVIYDPTDIENIHGDNKDYNTLFEVNKQYKEALKCFNKTYFDPFRRKEQLEFHYDFEYGEDKRTSIITNIGQLNIFRWIISNNMIAYITKHINEIRTDLEKTNNINVNSGGDGKDKKKLNDRNEKTLKKKQGTNKKIIDSKDNGDNKEGNKEGDKEGFTIKNEGEEKNNLKIIDKTTDESNASRRKRSQLSKNSHNKMRIHNGYHKVDYSFSIPTK